MTGRGSAGVAVVAATADVLDLLPSAFELLTDAERKRMASLRRRADQLDFVAAHALVRVCCASVFGSSLSAIVVQRCEVCGSGHGAPRLQSDPSVGLSLSHASGLVAAAAAPFAVGIDVEPLTHATGATEVVDSFSDPRERAALQTTSDPAAGALLLWVRKEALVKAGVTDLAGMTTLDLARTPLEPPIGPRRVSFGSYTLLDLRPPGLDALACAASPGLVRPASLLQLLSRVQELIGPGLSRPDQRLTDSAIRSKSLGT